MTLDCQRLRPDFAAQVISPIELRSVHEAKVLGEIRAAMDQYAVLVFRNQSMSDTEQLAFSQRFDGDLHARTGAAALHKSRLGSEALADISNLDESGEILQSGDRRRMYALGNRLWHTDASFQDPPGRYSMLSARVVPPVPADTEFADTRAAYDALPEELKARLEGKSAHHSIVYSRRTLGFEFSEAEDDLLRGAVHPLVRQLPGAQRKSLYLAAHASHIIGMPLPEGRLLLRDLIEHATQPEFVYCHRWQVDDFVIWDNRATMHRGRPYEDTKHRREMRRTTTLDK